MIIHPNFDVIGYLDLPKRGFLDSDIALLELEVSAKLSATVGVACLPKRSDANRMFVGTRLLVRYFEERQKTKKDRQTHRQTDRHFEMNMQIWVS